MTASEKDKILNLIFLNYEKISDSKTDDLFVEIATALDLLEKRDEFLSNIDNHIQVTNGETEYFRGMRNGMRFCKSLFDGNEPQYE